jgi:glutamine cyclotransferase
MRCLYLILFFGSWTTHAATTYEYKVVERVDQDPTLFTQGFVLKDGWFYQSSGLYGKSYFLRYPANGEQKAKKLEVPPDIFAEGLTVLGKDLFLVSWQSGMAWRFDANTFQLKDNYRFAGEGWGLTDDGQHLILSDGSDVLKFISPDNFAVQRKMSVTFLGNPVTNLNELEYVNGVIWANQWKSTTLYGIDADTGEVQFTVDLTGLQQEAGVNIIDSVANGIAYDSERELFWLTGKYWQYRYLVELRPKQSTLSSN